ncbi:phosphocholine-specific phospholipase C [Novosphingobium terrae]|uniref:phosphocholine-specific phospholipase C n=1 Tax=Novosphingobium terrae TaxID=2726189 RepID=UPI00197E617B|nr:phospholipase C, phosphocholine-specific [Novosphingobium terrae]
MIDRRALLRQSLQGAALASLPAGLAPILARAASIAPDRRSGTINDVAHIVVLMQENRGFDHYFGTMPGVRGFGDRFPIPLPSDADGTPRTVWDQRDAAATPPRRMRPFPLATQQDFDLMRMLGTPHTWSNAQAAWDNGRMAHWPEAKTQRSMAYYQQADIPFQWAMADAFTLCDAYHCAMHTGTNTNRLFLWTGSNDPLGKGGGPALDNPDDDLAKPDAASQPRFFWTTYPERLEAAGVSWRVYQDMADNFGDNPLANFLQYRAAYRGDAGSRKVLADKGLSTHALDALRADVLADRLPQISWIVGTTEGSEHPGPSSPAQGAAYTAKVIEALTANPAVWARTVLFINFDENDGFFDHVPPPAPPSPDADLPGGFAGASTVSTLGEYHHLRAPGADGDDLNLRGRPYGLGPRVPMYVLSPWSRGGRVHSEVSDHTSVIRFMERRFGVQEPNISAWRRAVCSDLTSAFDFAHAAPVQPILTPALTSTMAQAPDRSARAHAIAKQPDAHPPENQPLPTQHSGIRPACPARYQLEVTGGLSDGGVALTFSAGEGLASVFQVYDRLRLDLVPRRFTVEPGKQLSDHWPLHGAEKAYDLWVLGPAGFHRAFAGRAGGQEPELMWSIADGQLSLTVKPGHGGVKASAQAYRAHHRDWSPAAEGGTMRWPLAPTHGWYDMQVEGPNGWQRRFAGRIDGAWAAISDPASAS